MPLSRREKNPSPARHPVLRYSTPDVDDVVFYIQVDSTLKAWKTPVYGESYNSKDSEYANHKLVHVTSADGNGWVKWYYAADRDDQGAYNFEYKEPNSSGGRPLYTRTYFIPRDDIDDYFDECEGLPTNEAEFSEGTFTITGNVSEGETITIGDFTARVVDSGDLTQDNLINISDLDTPLSSSSAAAAIAALINGDCYSGVPIENPVPSTQVSAVVVGSTITVTALDHGTSGNSISTTDTLLNGSWSSSTLEGGVDFIYSNPHTKGSEFLEAGDPDPDYTFNPEFCGFSFTGQSFSRVPDNELDSLYILLVRTFEKLCVTTGTRLSNQTGLIEDYSSQIKPNSEVSPSGIDHNGVATTSSPINCDFSLVTTSTVKPFDTREYTTTVNFYWPAVLCYIDDMAWKLLDGSYRRYPRMVWARQAYRGPTKAVVSETWTKCPPDVPDIVTLETTAVAYACPLFSVNTGPCLHGDVSFICDFGNADPVWDLNVGSKRTTPATAYTDWPSSFISSAIVTPYNGGYILKTVTLYSPNASGVDTETPPLPDPAVFYVSPYAVSSTEVSMTALVPTDSPPCSIEYKFTSSSGNSSSWQKSNSYNDTGLTAGTTYSYSVTTRDKFGNTGNPSSSQSVTTLT